MRIVLTGLSIVIFHFTSIGQILFVKDGSDWGIINTSGNIIHKPQFEKWESLSTKDIGYRVMKKGKWGIVDPNGVLIIDTEYDRIFYTNRPGFNFLKVLIGSTPSKYGDELIGGIQGVYNFKGKLILPVEYDIINYNEGYFSVGKNVQNTSFHGNSDNSSYSITGSTWGLVDSTGKIIFQPTHFSCNYFGGVGYLDPGQYFKLNGQILDATKYESNSVLSNELFRVGKDGKYGIIDFDEKIIIPFEYDDMGNKIVNGMVAVNKGATRYEDYLNWPKYHPHYDQRTGGLWGVCSISGRVVLQMHYEKLEILSSKYLAVSKNNKWGVVDTNGTVIIPFKYDYLAFRNNYLWAQKANKKELYQLLDEKFILSPSNKKYKIIDCNNKYGVCIVALGTIYYSINREGKISEPLKNCKYYGGYLYDTAYGGVLYKVLSNIYFVSQNSKTLLCQDFIKDSLGALIRLDNKWGYIQPDGKWLIPAQYDTILPFSENLTFAKTGEDWVIINSKGKIQTKLGQKIKHAKPFSAGVAAVSSGGNADAFGGWQDEKWGYMDRNGYMLIDFQFDAAKEFKNQIAAVKIKVTQGESGIINSPKWMFINKRGQQVFSGYFDEVSY